MKLPGCYGSPVSVSAASASCQACPHSSGCALSASQFVAGLPDDAVTRRERQALSVARQCFASAPESRAGGKVTRVVVASSRGVKRVSLTPDEDRLVRSLPARVGSQVKRLIETGWFEHARSEISAGINPTTRGWRQVVCGALMAGETSRAGLQLAFETQLRLKPSSAKVQVSIALAVLAAGRLAIETEGCIRLRSN